MFYTKSTITFNIIYLSESTYPASFAAPFVDVVYQQRCCSTTGVSKLVIQYHHLQKLKYKDISALLTHTDRIT